MEAGETDSMNAGISFDSVLGLFFKVRSASGESRRFQLEGLSLVTLLYFLILYFLTVHVLVRIHFHSHATDGYRGVPKELKR